MCSMKVLLVVVLAVIASINAQFSGSASTNPSGGQDVNLLLSKHFGDSNKNVGGGLFASGNTLGGPVTRGGFLEANKNGHGLNLQHSKTDNFGSTFSQNVHANLLNQNNHNLNAQAFHSRTNLDNGFKFNRFGGGLDYNHANGHGAALTASRIPQLNMNTVDLTGRANLWRSPNRATALDLTGGLSRNFGGPSGGSNGQTNKHFGLGLTSHF